MYSFKPLLPFGSSSITDLIVNFLKKPEEVSSEGPITDYFFGLYDTFNGQQKQKNEFQKNFDDIMKEVFLKLEFDEIETLEENRIFSSLLDSINDKLRELNVNLLFKGDKYLEYKEKIRANQNSNQGVSFCESKNDTPKSEELRVESDESKVESDESKKEDNQSRIPNKSKGKSKKQVSCILM